MCWCSIVSAFVRVRYICCVFVYARVTILESTLQKPSISFYRSVCSMRIIHSHFMSTHTDTKLCLHTCERVKALTRHTSFAMHVTRLYTWCTCACMRARKCSCMRVFAFVCWACVCVCTFSAAFSELANQPASQQPMLLLSYAFDICYKNFNPTV